jgi:hypothetical protein
MTNSSDTAIWRMNQGVPQKTASGVDLQHRFDSIDEI